MDGFNLRPQSFKNCAKIAENRDRGEICSNLACFLTYRKMYSVPLSHQKTKFNMREGGGDRNIILKTFENGKQQFIPLFLRKHKK